MGVIYEKGVYFDALTLTIQESRKFKRSVIGKAMVNASQGVFADSLHRLVLSEMGARMIIQIHQREAFSLLVPTDRAMREPLNRGAS